MLVLEISPYDFLSNEGIGARQTLALLQGEVGSTRPPHPATKDSSQKVTLMLKGMGVTLLISSGCLSSHAYSWTIPFSMSISID